MFSLGSKNILLLDETDTFYSFYGVIGVNIGQEFMSNHKKLMFVRLYVQKIL
jgi:hypothetical protein